MNETATAETICARHGDAPAALIEILHDIQDALGHVPEAVLPAVAARLNLGRAEVHGVASFYHDFRSEPAGRVVVKLCRAEACHAMGAAALFADVCRRHGIEPGGTSRAGVTVEAVYCLGNCALSPAALVNGRPLGRCTAEALEAAIAGDLA